MHTLSIDRPIDEIFEDWDYLNDKVVEKYWCFTSSGENVIGIRRREITLTEIVDPAKGTMNSMLMTTEGLIAKNQ